MRTYDFGCIQALRKLGMAADVGPIAYAPVSSRDSSLGVENKRQDFWKSVDDEPFTTGTESGLSMPSGSKTGSDYGYGQPMGSYGVGGQDANQHLPDRNKRLSDAMQNAFDANEKMDQSYAPESASTQPFGPKMAATIPSFGASGSRGAFSVPRLGGQPKMNTSMGMHPGQGIKAPTALSPQHSVAQSAMRTSRTNVHAQQPNATGAVGSRIAPQTNNIGGAPLNAVAMAPKVPDMTTTAPAGPM